MKPLTQPGEAAERTDEAVQPESSPGAWLKAAGEAIVFVFLVALKLGVKLKALWLLLPKLKLLTTFGSMLVSIGAYALIWGWAFAAGFVLLLFVHELGHVVQLRREGVEASAPMFIPFLGAVISAKSLGEDAAAEARVGLAGPVLGTVGTLIPLGLWLATGDDFWRALAYVGFFINLFNLLPVLPLDGGRAMAAVSPWVWGVGFGALIPLLIFFPDPILVLILVFGLIECWHRWKARNSPKGRAYFDIPGRTRALVAVTYLALAALLAGGMSETFVERGFGESTEAEVSEKRAGSAPLPYVAPRFSLDAIEPRAGGVVSVTATFPEPGTVSAGDKGDGSVGPTRTGGPVLLVQRSLPVRTGPATFELRATTTALSKLNRVGSLETKLRLAYTPKGKLSPQYRTAAVALIDG